MSAIELTTMQSSSLGERLHIARVHLGLTQEQVAGQLRIIRDLANHNQALLDELAGEL